MYGKKNFMIISYCKKWISLLCYWDTNLMSKIFLTKSRYYKVYVIKFEMLKHKINKRNDKRFNNRGYALFF